MSIKRRAFADRKKYAKDASPLMEAKYFLVDNKKIFVFKGFIINNTVLTNNPFLMEFYFKN